MTRLDPCILCNGSGSRPKSGGDPVTEHAIEMSSGAMQVRASGELTERYAPLAQWIQAKQMDGKVWRRHVIVVDDWEEVPRG